MEFDTSHTTHIYLSIWLADPNSGEEEHFLTGVIGEKGQDRKRGEVSENSFGRISINSTLECGSPG